APTAAQEQTILSTWAQYVPNAAFDVAYSWGVQNNDTALANDPALQSVFAANNAGTSSGSSDVLTPSAVAISGTAGQPLNNVAVATFADSNKSLTASGFTAAINWGDGTTSAGGVSGSNGSFTVSGTHTYSAAGTDKVAVTLTENAPGNASATANSTAQIGAAGSALSGKLQLSKATEGAAISGSTTVATFTDSNTADTAAGFTATITWGDGTTSAGTVTGSNGSFSVSAGHTYADEGSFPLSATITRTADKTSIMPTGTIAVAEADTLTPHAATITATAGKALNNVTVATFTDADKASGAGGFTASIAWGDGTTSAGTVSGSNGTFTVSGSHTYAAAGTDAVAVTLTDKAPGSATATANSTATVSGGSPPPPPPPGGVPSYSHVVVVMEENHSFNEIIGNSAAPYINGTLAAGGALLTNYSALTHPSEPNYFGIYAGNTFGISDDNHYSEPDPTLATVLQAAGKTFTGYVESNGSSYDHNPWESFPEGFSVEKDFSTFPSSSNFASLPTVSFVIPGVNDDMHNGTIGQGDTWLQNNINAYAQWAKSNNSLLMVVWDEDDGAQNNQVPAILYGAGVSPGNYATTYNHYDTLATIAAAAGVTAPNNAATAAPITGMFGAAISPLSSKVQLSSATEGTALPGSTKVATFTDTNTADTAAAFTAIITWGDGTTSAGTISGSNGSFSVSGGHTYADEGSLPFSVTITRTADKASIAPAGTIAVAEADILTPHAVSIIGTAGQPLNNVTVATFTDADKASGAGDFTASIAWGDGTTSAGTVSGSNGTFTVSGSHTYAAAGTDAVAVTLADDAPGTAKATANSTAQIASATGGLSGKVQLTSATEGTALPGSTKVATFTDSNTADTAAGFTASITWGDGTTSAGTVGGSNGSFSVTGGHTYADEGSFPLSVAITRTADKATVTPTGTVTAAEADALTPHAVSISGTAGQALNNIAVATFTDADKASGAGDFTASIAWGDGTTSAGTVSGSNGTFTVSGSHTYAAAGTDTVAVTLTDDAPGTAKATANSTAQIASAGGGSGGSGGGGLTISSATTGPLAFSSSDSPLTITSSGKVSSTGTNVDAIDGPSGARSVVVNSGSVSAAGSSGAGVYLQAGGTVTNNSGAVLSGDYGVYMDAPGIVINAGTISGRTAAVHFSNTGANRLVVDPTAVFSGIVNGGSAASSLELAGGTGSISGLSGGSGTISQNGSWSFSNFNTLVVDTGSTWNLNSGSLATVTDNGTIGVQGSLDVSSAIDPGSSGLFQLTSGSTLEVAAAVGSNTRMAFLNSAELIVDNPLAFGSQVGSASYAGPQLQGFGGGSKIDLRQFSSAGATTLYSASTGLLQISNSANQRATLEFQAASLGKGTFHTASDGGGGILITLS
ncbi:MAG TPA: alkaline phosphatase family protein, partial [Acetobacteraceae bacterium]